MDRRLREAIKEATTTEELLELASALLRSGCAESAYRLLREAPDEDVRVCAVGMDPLEEARALLYRDNPDERGSQVVYDNARARAKFARDCPRAGQPVPHGERGVVIWSGVKTFPGYRGMQTRISVGVKCCSDGSVFFTSASNCSTLPIEEWVLDYERAVKRILTACARKVTVAALKRDLPEGCWVRFQQADGSVIEGRVTWRGERLNKETRLNESRLGVRDRDRMQHWVWLSNVTHWRPKGYRKWTPFGG